MPEDYREPGVPMDLERAEELRKKMEAKRSKPDDIVDVICKRMAEQMWKLVIEESIIPMIKKDEWVGAINSALRNHTDLPAMVEATNEAQDKCAEILRAAIAKLTDKGKRA